MDINARQTKLFIKVDGVIGSRRQICTFCHGTIIGAAKVVETTRKLRRGPYFPQLAYLQSSVGKIDSLGRAVVCLSCFHQLLRQWSTYENNNVQPQRRSYRYVSDKGVKNFQETRTIEIRKEAEKRAFAIHTKQEDIIKKSFAKLTKVLDIEEDIVTGSEERIVELNRELRHCTKGEKWKINREIQNQKKITKVAEVKIEEEEDKEEEIRKETKRLLEAYKKNSSLFRATSEPNIFSKTQQEIVMTERDIDSFSKGKVFTASRDSGYFDRVSDSFSKESSTSQPVMNFDQDYQTTIVTTTKTTRAKRVQSDDSSHRYNAEKIARDQIVNIDVWDQVKSPRTSIYEEKYETDPLDEDWRLVQEIVYSPNADVRPPIDDVWANIFTQETGSDMGETFQSNSRENLNDDWNFEKRASSNDIDLITDRQNAVDERKSSWNETSNAKQQFVPAKQQPKTEYNLVKEVVSSVESFPDDEWSKLFEQKDQCDDKQVKGVEDHRQKSHSTSRDEKLTYYERSNKSVEDQNTDESDEERQQMYTVNAESVSDPRFQHTEQNVRYAIHSQHRNIPGKLSQDNILTTPISSSTSNYAFSDPWDSIHVEKEKLQSQHNSFDQDKDDSYSDEYEQDFTSGSEKEVLPPRRLDKSRFHSFTKSSFHSQHLKKEHPTTTTTKDSEKVNHTAQQTSPRSKKYQDVTIIERQHNHVQKQERIISDELLTNRRNLHDRHLSFEEEEWERKNLNPRRLDESKLSSFFNQVSNDNIEYVLDERETSPTHQKRVGNNDEKNNERYIKHSNTRQRSDVNGEIGTVQSGPALKKLLRQNEITREQPIQKTVSKGSLKSDPWESLDSTRSMQSSKALAESHNVDNDNFSKVTVGVGRIDLKRWNTEVERNKMRETNGDVDTRVNYAINDTRNSDAYIPLITIIDNQLPGENVSSHKRTTNYPKKENSQRDITVEEKDFDDDDINRRRISIGKVDLSVWQQNNRSQHKLNEQGKPPEKETNGHPLNPNVVQTNRLHGNNVAYDESFTHDTSILDSAQTKIVDVKKRTRQESTQQRNLKNDLSTSSRPPSFNQSMSEDEIAWEKRFSKSYENSEENDILVIQKSFLESKKPQINESPRLDENSNSIVIGKISLDENEVRRIRKGRESQRSDKSSSKEREGMHHQNSSAFPSSTQSETTYAVMSQLSEEEVWEKRRSNPGKLDFSKFSQFT